MYQEELMDHYHHPRYRGTLPVPDIDSGQHNPSCGDAVIIQAQINNGIISAIAFQGSGCVISQATASMLVEHALHKAPAELLQFSTNDLLELIKIPLGPTRLKCGLLALYALHEGLNIYLQRER